MRSFLILFCVIGLLETISTVALAEDRHDLTVEKSGIEKSFIEEHEAFRQQHNDTHEIARIKNRALTAPVANNGYTRYKYTYIPKFVDCEHVGEKAGNVTSAGGVYNVTVVSDPAVIAKACPGLIGNVTTTGGDVTNYVEIEGSVTGTGQPIAIGNTVAIGHAGSVTNTVTINGNVRSSGNVNIGNTQILHGKAEQVTNRVVIQGNIKSGRTVTIGGLKLNGGDANVIDQSVTIDGNITAE